MHNVSLALFVLVMILQALDGYLTWRVLAAGGRELNPIVRALVERLGVVPGLVLAKVAFAVVAGALILEQPIALLLVAILYSWVVVHNWRQLAAKRGAA